MSTSLSAGSQTAQWHELVIDAETAAGTQLGESLESYLVFLLMRFTNRPDMASSILALEFLQGAHQHGQARQDIMRDVGDKCLLFSGLFPQRAQRRRVKISYFVDLGRSAYQTLASEQRASLSEMFTQLAHGFVTMMDVLQAMRAMNTEMPLLDPIDAYELWQDTGSQQARKSLSQATNIDSVVMNTTSHSKQ